MSNAYGNFTTPQSIKNRGFKPIPTIAQIKDYLAFYPNRVDSIEELAD
jgi:hypothetical protein